MSYRWPNKDPNETLDYSIDWSRFLRAPATIVDAQWFIDDATGTKTPFNATDVVNGLQGISETVTETVTTIYLGLGTNNITYKLYCRMTDSQGRVAERVVTLPVKER